MTTDPKKMSLSQLESALNGAKKKLTGMEQELAAYRKSVQSYVLEFGKRQRKFEREFGMIPGGEKDDGGSSATSVGNARRRTRKGTIASMIESTLSGSNKPLSAKDIFGSVGGSKASVTQTLMKLVQEGKVQRFNKDGKPISAKDKTQRAKSYALA